MVWSSCNPQSPDNKGALVCRAGITEGLPKTQDPNHHLQWALRRLTVEEVGSLANIQMDSFFIFTAALPAEVLCNVRERERFRLTRTRSQVRGFSNQNL